MIKFPLILAASLSLFTTSCGQIWTISEEGISTVKDGVIIHLDKDGNISLTKSGAYAQPGAVKVTLAKK